jgi:ankyrin repeat protein
MSLIKAVKENDIESVKRIIVCDGVDVNYVDSDGYTALLWTGPKGLVDCVKILLDAKADVDKANSNGQTPLHIAAACGRVECVKVGLFCVVR